MVAAVVISWRKRDRRKRGSLTRRAVAVCALVSGLIGVAFFSLALAIDGLRGSESSANHALEVTVAANRLERMVVDVETTERGYIITAAPDFLPPWYQAQGEFTSQSAVLVHLARAGDPGQAQRAQQIVDAGTSYIRYYSVPVVTAAQRDPATARTVAVTMEGRRQIDALRAKFDQFMKSENEIFKSRQERADASASRAVWGASAGVAASIVLILLSGGYLVRSVVRPVRRTSAMAGRVAGGDLTVRMPDTGPAEVGDLQRSFNTMADSLEANQE
jgi:CHASE3 domain sensor protein